MHKVVAEIYTFTRAQVEAHERAIEDIRLANESLRAQLKIAAAGLKHCAGWNISDEKRAALMAVVLESEALLGPNV